MLPAEQTEDTILLAGMAAGTYADFTKLYDKYCKSLTDYGLRFTNDVDTVRDCLHDLFVSLWSRRQQLAIHSSLKSYLVKAVRTSVVQKTSRNSKVRSLNESSDEDYNFHLVLTPEQHYVSVENNNELYQNIQQLLTRLSPLQKEVIYLRYYQDLSFDEIAEQLNTTVNACYKLMNRAMVELRKTAPKALPLLLWLLTASKSRTGKIF